ncbi:SDR family NAD(P)-dependent oxidoreductase (plasmid) [Ralstonia syzygii subsp. celebesensis]|uniref:3-hydroxyacyl-CoA dehydrogenase n=2 Tax=Ralstonia syzygii subsp. celebesensis TaxID=1310168 RepID=A0A1U9VQ00_9RALS|nr:SDR family NAD(P)-dependent oxidoreductase [Ralstonia syzygii]AQW32666.1 3-hydroxyacyl-CoA dehydrogenase [blood disease bacterium A2-HR MARDI]QQV58177.1 SDR family oxidoreductase [Ralstonia syzygii subsp. celebesensis]CCA83721.1 putative oxidoreductase (beta-hydroxyacyl-CoA dehydrogenase) protein (abmB) [blood disease bacterium R229]
MATLAGHHAVVTGAGRGIGAAIATRLAADGATLTLMGRNAAVLEATAATLPAVARTQVVTCDVADAASVALAFASARAGLGPISILINNAGQAESAPFAKTTLEHWQRMLAVNLTGTFLCTQAVLAEVQASGRGRIVNVASTAGLRGYAYVSAYTAAKHGVIGLTRSLALELATRGVTVNAVCPGYTDTDIVRESIDRIVARTGRSAEAARAELVKGNPQGRLVTPDEVADAVAWLCSDGAASINGQAISVSGGEVM